MKVKIGKAIQARQSRKLPMVWAAGINLAPLVERFAEMQAKAEALELQARAIQQCRAEIRQLGQRIREAGDQALRERAE